MLRNKYFAGIDKSISRDVQYMSDTVQINTNWEYGGIFHVTILAYLEIYLIIFLRS